MFIGIKSIVVISSIVAAFAVTCAVAIAIQGNQAADAQQQGPQQSLAVRTQRTTMSTEAPVGQQPRHQVVFALPIREDGRIWEGRVTFTASKPIEIEVLHVYNPSQIPDEQHGEPITAILNGTKVANISYDRNS